MAERNKVKAKGTPYMAVRPTVKESYSCTLSLASALEGSEMASPTSRPLYPRERPGAHCTGGWVGPGLVWTGAGNLAATRIRSLDRPVRSESLYRPPERNSPAIFIFLFITSLSLMFNCDNAVKLSHFL
jgi:hypothetical protein